ncbi:MAG: sulfatase-like hydrolase/transferase, partial [Bacteroidota bacterium]|nr:sulfatase-like hydrolase/transferase [Bacteroidota bacterium]
EYLVCVDVDCVLEQDALLKMIKPFLEDSGHRVIASGGVVRVANDCRIENGKLVEVRLPKKFLPRMQTLEYIRAFLLGRMAWSRLNGLLLISGAFGAFDKEIVIECGGYSVKTVGEDMELIVRMRRYMEEKKLPYRVTFIPDPLCWTEAPYNYKILGRQRNRWTRGTIETLKTHRVMFFNPKYHLLGMLSYPYWFFFEFLAPIVEFVGFVGFLIFTILGWTQWKVFFLLLGCILSFGFLFSLFAILMEVLTYHQYKSRKDFFKLVLTAFLEPVLFHPFIVYSALKGNIDYLRKSHNWGEMTRQGLGKGAVNKAGSVQAAALAAGNGSQEHLAAAIPGRRSRLVAGLQESISYFAILLGSMVFVKIFGLIREWHQFGPPAQFSKVIEYGLANEISFDLNFAFIPIALFLLFYLVHKRAARFFFVSFSVVVIFIHAALGEYFLQTLVPLGADLFGYSLADIKQTIEAAGIPVFFIGFLLAMLGLIISLFVILPRKIKFKPGLALVSLGMVVLSALFSISSITRLWRPGPEFSNSMALDKSAFFYRNCYRALFGADRTVVSLDNANATTGAFHYVDEKKYPFLHTVDSTDVLAPFFRKGQGNPNFVFIVVEGLGRAFSNKGAYLGSFTPFLDSLSGHSLYWNNFLSEGGRTFAMLPSIFGSLPFGKNGFLELGSQMPPHQSFLRILKDQGYSTNFFYGGDGSFDNMNLYVTMDGGNVYDEKTFDPTYSKMPSSNHGFTWGYGDSDVLNRCYEVSKGIGKPFCDVIMTLSTHSPFLIAHQDYYRQLFEDRMNALHFTDAQKVDHRRYEDQFATILYADDAISSFVHECQNLPGYQNTIFVITGDHRMPEIPMSTKIDRYHVPLIIYSPLLKRTGQFPAISTHFDLTPSFLALLRDQYQFKVPQLADWMGTGLDTAHFFRNTHSYPLIQTKNDLVDFISGTYMINNGDLFKISSDLDLEPVEDNTQQARLENLFGIFKSRNATIRTNAHILPDSLTSH